MLVLTRREGEEIYIRVPNSEELLKVKVGHIRGNAIRLAIDAPKEYKVYRKEVYEEREELKQSLKINRPYRLPKERK